MEKSILNDIKKEQDRILSTVEYEKVENVAKEFLKSKVASKMIQMGLSIPHMICDIPFESGKYELHCTVPLNEKILLRKMKNNDRDIEITILDADRVLTPRQRDKLKLEQITFIPERSWQDFKKVIPIEESDAELLKIMEEFEKNIKISESQLEVELRDVQARKRNLDQMIKFLQR
jgi:hypothetical protein